jgi:hypothetical protein
MFGWADSCVAFFATNEHVLCARSATPQEVVKPDIFWYDAGRPENLPEPFKNINMGGLLAWEFILMHWVEVRRWQDYKNFGSVNEVGGCDSTGVLWGLLEFQKRKWIIGSTTAACESSRLGGGGGATHQPASASPPVKIRRSSSLGRGTTSHATPQVGMAVHKPLGD